MTIETAEGLRRSATWPEQVIPADVKAKTEELDSKASGWETTAGVVCIIDQQTYEQAAALLVGIKGLQKEIADTWAPMQTAAHGAWQAIISQRKKVEAPLASAETTIKQKIAVFHFEQAEIQRKLEAEHRAAEEQRQAEAIEAQALEAEAAGASRDEVTAIIAQPIMIAPVMRQPIKATGVGARTKYKARCLSLMALIKAAAQNPQLASLLKVDESALNKLADSQKTLFSVPGCEVYPETIVTARSN